MAGFRLIRRVVHCTAHKARAIRLPRTIPLKTITDELARNTLAIERSVIPRAFSSPIVEIFSNSIISRPEIILKPATIVIRTRMKSTLKSIRFSQSKSCGYISTADDDTTGSSSSDESL